MGFAAASERYKLIWTPAQDPARRPTADRPIFELYDLEQDPGERRNLAQARPELFGELHASLNRWLDESARMAATFEPGPPAELTESEIRRLRSLGYVD
jgi:hypothetical protein